MNENFVFDFSAGYTTYWTPHPWFLHPRRGRSQRLRVLKVRCHRVRSLMRSLQALSRKSKTIIPPLILLFFPDQHFPVQHWAMPLARWNLGHMSHLCWKGHHYSYNDRYSWWKWCWLIWNVVVHLPYYPLEVVCHILWKEMFTDVCC